MLKLLPIFVLLALSSCASNRKNGEEKSKENRHALSLDTIDEISDRVQKVVAAQIGEGKNTGAIVGIFLQGKSKLLSFGETKKGNKTLPNENTVFEIGSLTKTFTGLLMAQEIESKKIQETDKIGSIQKKWANQKPGDITLLELVTHRSGLPRLPCNLDASDPLQPYTLYSEEDLNDLFKDKKREILVDCNFEVHPTKKIIPSNLAFGTLGYLLGLKEKTTYMDLLKKKILKPLNMEDTTYDLSREQIQRLAQGYDENGNPVPMWKRQVLMGEGALRSTAADLFVYAQSYIHPDTTTIAAAMQRSTQLQYDDKAGTKMGYAWFLKSTGSFSANGMTGGHASYLRIYPKGEFAIFYLTNTAKDLKCINEAVADQPCPPGPPAHL